MPILLLGISITPPEGGLQQQREISWINNFTMNKRSMSKYFTQDAYIVFSHACTRQKATTDYSGLNGWTWHVRWHGPRDEWSLNPCTFTQR